MSQLSVFEGFEGFNASSEPPAFPRWKDDTATDLHAVVSSIPHVGHRKGTSRESVQRPCAYLYFRPDRLGELERERCFDLAEACTGASVRGGFQHTAAAGDVLVTGTPGVEISDNLRLVRDDGVIFYTDCFGESEVIDENGQALVEVVALTTHARAETKAGERLTFTESMVGVDAVATVDANGLTRRLTGPIATRGFRIAHAGGGWWVRLNGESAVYEGRQGSKPCSGTDLDAAFMLEFRLSTTMPKQAQMTTLAFLEQATAGAAAVGCQVRTKARRLPSPIYAESLEQLVLALHWSPTIAAAVGFVLCGCKPKSEDWRVAIDLALEQGQPWAEGLALLSRRPDGDSILRALRWMFENKRTP